MRKNYGMGILKVSIQQLEASLLLYKTACACFEKGRI